MEPMTTPSLLQQPLVEISRIARSSICRIFKSMHVTKRIAISVVSVSHSKTHTSIRKSFLVLIYADRNRLG